MNLYQNLIAFLFTAGAITLAEMGDKTQLLAMAFATKYKPSKVFAGITIAIVLLSATAVAVGNYITRFEAAQVWIQGIAALSFILFGLWTLKGEDEEEEEENVSKMKFGPIATVAVAFFIAELGDKTQLATMVFAAKFPESPFGVFLGGTVGLIIANAIGIGLGGIISKKVSEKTIKLVSASVFMIFGFLGCFQVAKGMLKLDMLTILIGMTIIVIVTIISAYLILKKQDQKLNTGNK